MNTLWKRATTAALGAGLALAASAAAADVLLIQAIRQEPPNAPGGLERPRQMMTMDEVEARFGAPQRRIAPVGDPPITRWLYPAYTVYFERRFVLNTVVHPQFADLPATADDSAGRPPVEEPAGPESGG